MARQLARRQRSYSMTDIDMAQGLSSDVDSYCIRLCKHHPIAPQHPDGNATKHLQSLSEFVKAVAGGLSRLTFPRTQQQYASVHALMISWEDDDLGTEADVQRLQCLFETTYGVSTTHFKIPSSKEPEFDLDVVIASTKDLCGRKDDGLLVVYYGGHGEIDRSTQHSIWKAWKFPPKHASAASSPQIDWTELQQSVFKSKGDVLFILDCCYASGAVQTFDQKYNFQQNQKRQRNLLLASGNDKASNQNTFTKAIIYELEDLETPSCTVYSLHHRIVENRSFHQWTTAPIHIGERCIVLAPLPIPGAPTTSGQQQLVLREESMLQVKSRCRILVSVTLTELGTQSPRDAWVEWFRDHAPGNIVAIEFLDIIKPVAALSSNSAYLIFTLPVSVWNAMTPNDAIKFLSVVYSENR